MATSWRNPHRHGSHGNQTITTFPPPFTTPNRLFHCLSCRHSRGGLAMTQSQPMEIRLHHTTRWSLSPYFGLAFRALWVTQFPGIYSNVPPYILNSSYPFSEYEQLSHRIENIISGYIET